MIKQGSLPSLFLRYEKCIKIAVYASLCCTLNVKKAVSVDFLNCNLKALK